MRLVFFTFTSESVKHIQLMCLHNPFCSSSMVSHKYVTRTIYDIVSERDEAQLRAISYHRGSLQSSDDFMIT